MHPIQSYKMFVLNWLKMENLKSILEIATNIFQILNGGRELKVISIFILSSQVFHFVEWEREKNGGYKRVSVMSIFIYFVRARQSRCFDAVTWCSSWDLSTSNSWLAWCGVQTKSLRAQYAGAHVASNRTK